MWHLPGLAVVFWEIVAQLYPQPADELSLAAKDAKANICKFSTGSSSQSNVQEGSGVEHWQLNDSYGSPKP